MPVKLEASQRPYDPFRGTRKNGQINVAFLFEKGVLTQSEHLNKYTRPADS